MTVLAAVAAVMSSAIAWHERSGPGCTDEQLYRFIFVVAAPAVAAASLAMLFIGRGWRTAPNWVTFTVVALAVVPFALAVVAWNASSSGAYLWFTDYCNQ